MFILRRKDHPTPGRPVLCKARTLYPMLKLSNWMLFLSLPKEGLFVLPAAWSFAWGCAFSPDVIYLNNKKRRNWNPIYNGYRTCFVQPGKIEIDANERAVIDKFKAAFSFASSSILSLTICQACIETDKLEFVGHERLSKSILWRKNENKKSNCCSV